MDSSDGQEGDWSLSPPPIWVLAFVGLLVAYLVAGYYLVPALMIPLGCSPGDEAVLYGPATAMNVSYLEDADALEVTHSGATI